MKNGDRIVPYENVADGIRDAVSRSTNKPMYGLIRATKEAKIPASRIQVMGDAATRQSGFDVTKDIIANGIESVGILAYNDIVASGILAALRDSEYKIGSDISVVSIDDIESSKFESPPLTTVNVGAFELGQKAAESLLELVEGGKKVRKTVFLDNKLIVRESCGCTREKKVS
jgi:DNA-binding LacI/PurR family transcriptional regulator